MPYQIAIGRRRPEGPHRAMRDLIENIMDDFFTEGGIKKGGRG